MKITRNHGTAQQFKNAVEDKINNLSSSVKAASDDESRERYIHNLIGDIDAELGAYFDSITFDNKKDALIITTVLDSEVNEFNVPYTDMKFNNLKRDTQLICNEIEDEINTEYVDECTDIKSSEEPNWREINDQYEDEADRVEQAVIAKLKDAGVDIDTEEAQWYMDGAVDLILQDDDHDVETWWKETLANYKDELDELPHVRGNV